MKSQHALAALALVFALSHVPFIATSLEDIDSVNFAMGLRDFNVAEHRPHPPGYPVYIAMGKVSAAITGAVSSGEPSTIDARALSILSLLAGLAAIPLLYFLFSAVCSEIAAVSATAITIACPLFWYLAVRPMSDLPGLAVALGSQACLLMAFQRKTPADAGRLIVAGAFLAAISIGMRSQTAWFTLPLLVLVLGDRIGRGVAGAAIGSAMTFTIGGLLWGIPLIVASGGLGAYLTILQTTAGDEFAAGEMLYLHRNARTLALVLQRTFVYPWDSTPLAVIVIALAIAGVVRLLISDRRTLVALFAMAAPYAAFHLIIQDTSFVRYALPLVPPIALLAVKGAGFVTEQAVPVAAAVITVWSVIVATPVLQAYASEPSPTVRVVKAMEAESATHKPGALAMHQTYKRPLDAELISIGPQLPSPPRLEWLELAKYWKDHTEPLWFLADPSRSDLALIDPQSRLDYHDITWPLVARPSFGGMRPDRVRWYEMGAPGLFAEEGWSLTPETSGMALAMGKEPHLAPIVADVRRRSGPARILIGGRNLAGKSDPSARFTLAIDGKEIESWDVAPGFFLRTIDLPAGSLEGAGPLAKLTIGSLPAAVPTAVEQFDLQDPGTQMWGFADGWNEAEYDQRLGVWRWTTDKATLKIVGSPQNTRISLRIESPLRYFDRPSKVRIMAGDRLLADREVSDTLTWEITVPADALSASGGLVTIETDQVFVPFERNGGLDKRHLGLRIFSADVAVSLTSREATR